MLTTQELGEADLIVTLLGEQHGKVRAVARSARRSRRRFGGLLEPLTHVQAAWTEKEGRELHRLDGLDGLRSFATMQAEPVSQAACAVLSEIIRAFAQEGHGEPRDFRLLGATLDAMEQGGDPWVLIRYFEYWTLRTHGLLPDFDHCASCGRPLESASGIRVARGEGPICGSCPSPSGPSKRLTVAERQFLLDARRLPPARISLQDPRQLRGSGALEFALRGTLEIYAERSFRAYRHFAAAERFASGGGSA